MKILQAIDDPALFAPWFRRGNWSAWRAFLATVFGLTPPDGGELHRRCTGRSALNEAAFSEGWLIIGRRGGKSFILALIAVFLAAFHDYRPYLQPGERATIMVLASDKRQARVIMRYATALLEGVPMLRQLIGTSTAESVDLRNLVSLEIHAASFRGTRDHTLAAVLADEIAFWRSEESANPDREILAALRPGMATIPGSMLLCASSPYARRGALYDAYRRHFGQEGSPVLVWQAPSQVMNPSIPDRVIGQAYEEDPASAAAEYGAQFRDDVESYIGCEALNGLVSTGVRERGRISGNRYVGFVDPSGGSRDSMTLAIAHAERDEVILDALREVLPPFSPEAAVKEFAGVLKAYGLRSVSGDRYAGDWPRERFREHGIEYKVADRTRSDLYRDLLPLLNSDRVDLLENQRLVSQLSALERRTSRGGHDTIDHASGGHDDLANAAAGALLMAESNRSNRVLSKPVIFTVPRSDEIPGLY